MNTESMGTGMPGSKIPIYELAKELGILNKDLVTKIRALGIEAKNHMSRLEPEDVLRIRRAVDKERQENTVQERLSDTVIRRRAKDGTMLRQPAAPPPPPAPPPAPAAPTVFVRPAAAARAPGAEAPAARPATSVVTEPKPVARPVPVAAPVVSAAPETRPAPVEAKPATAKPELEVKAKVDTAPAARPQPAPVVAAKPEVPAPAAKSEPAAPVVAKTEPAPVAKAEVAPAAKVEPMVVAPKLEPAAATTKPSVVTAKVESPAPAKVTPPVVSQPAAVAPVVSSKSVAPLVTTVVKEPTAVVEAPAKPVPPVAKSEEQAAKPAVAPIAARPTKPTEPVAKPVAAAPSEQARKVEEPARKPEPQAEAAAPSRVFVTAQTRRASEGLGPTGRVIDLAAFRPPAPPPPKPSAESPRAGFREPDPAAARGPRQEVTGERLRQPPKQQVTMRAGAKQKPQVGRKAKSTQITTAAEHKRVVKMDEAIVIAELARQMGLKATDVLKKIWELGMRSVMINSPIDFDTAQLVATEFDWRVESTAFQEQSVVSDVADNAEDLLPRAPVITIMGHVDHGKTSLLDAIRNANVAAGEAGGITQHIGAYKVSSTQGDVVFLDTPGHEAFTEMRARGAQVTDIVVLVVAADDGVMPQTVEALNHAKDAEVPIIVAVNKIDKPGAQPDRIRQQLSAHGLQPEEWGGDTIYVDVSARTKLGIDKLLEMLALQSDVMELKANPNKAARGSVVEARMDAKRGSVATVLVQEGTLKSGDIVCVGEEMGKVRAMMDDKGRQLTTAGPSTPVEVLGLSGVPRAGEVLNVVTDERAAKELVEFRRTRRIDKERAKAGPVSLDKLMDAMKAGLKELKVILKSDVQGSAEALSSALQKLSTSQVKVTVIQSGVGGITETDVNLAKAGNAIIIGFHVRPAGKANSLAEQEGVDIKLYDIIYDALDDVKRAMAGLLAPVKRDKQLGKAEVRELFSIPKIGVVLGCHVTEGVIKRAALIRLVRDSVLVHTGKLGSLRRFKDDVREVLQGYECGLTIDGYLDVKLGDVIECFEIEETAATLS